MFLVFWRPQEWLFPWMFGWPIMDVIVCASMLSLLMESEQGRITIPTKMPQIWLLLGLWVAAIMSHVAHFYFAGMIEAIPIVFKFCFFNALLFCVLDRVARIRIVAIIFVVVACVMSVHALMQERIGYGFAGQLPMWVPPLRGNPAYTRSLFFGIFNDPNDLAQFLATSIPFVFAFPWRRSFWRFLLSCGITAFILMAIFATHSRGGLVALVMVSAVMFALLLPTRWLPYMLSIVVVGGLLACPFAYGYMDKSAFDRIIFWGLANRMFKENLIFGIGYDMFWMVADDRASHNAFVGCYTTIGFFGYWFWFSLLQLAVVGAWRTRVAFTHPKTIEQEWLKRFAGFGIASIVGFCASSYFLSRAFVYPMFFLMVLLGSLPVVAMKLLPKDHPPLIRPEWDLFVMGTLGSIASILYIYFSIVLLNRTMGY